MKTFIQTLCIGGLLVAAAGCASKDEKAKAERQSPISIEAKQVAAEQNAAFVTEFAFPKGKSALTPAAKTQLEEVVAKAQSAGKIKEIKVISWGDAEYPSVHTKKLSRAEVKLVKDRNKSVENFVKHHEDTSVNSYSMAERPGTLAEIFSSSDAKIKKSLEVAGIPTTDTAVKVPAKSSRSIVVVILE